MEELPSVKIISRKRKKSPPSMSQNVGALTRSKAQMLTRRNRSGLTRSSSFSKLSSAAEELSVANYDHSSRILSIKDLRTRRVFSPDINSILEEQREENVASGKELEDLELRSGLDLISDVRLGDVDESENSDEVMISELEGVKHNSSENGLNLKDDAVYGNEPVPKNRRNLRLCTRKKVFKSPGSFSYRRLLPYLIDRESDESSVSKIDIVDDGISLQNVKSYPRLPAQNRSSGELEHAIFNSDNVKVSGALEIQSLQSGPCYREDLGFIKPEVIETTDSIRLLKMDQKNQEVGGSRVDIALTESVQMTPPDPDIFTETGIGEIIVESDILLMKDHMRNGLSVGGARSSSIVVSQNVKQDIKSINSLVLKPCSRPRVFNNPQSVSYRRLLPFLMENSNHNSFQKQKPVVELKGISHSSFSASPVEQKQVNITITESVSEKPHSEDLSENSRPETDSSFGGSSWNNITNPSSSTHLTSFTSDPSNVEPILEASENTSPSCIFYFQAEGKFLSESNPRKIELHCPHNHINGFGYNRPAVSPFADASHAILNGQTFVEVAETEVFTKQDNCVDMGVHYDNMESIDKVCLNQSLLKVEVCDTLFSAVDRPPKGILKKNRRGCRGSCNCLNCASFRLHAERAYEFSRNQMHDAEEVASKLMNELGKLRCLLERSVANDDNAAAIIPLNLIQVKQACIEALKTEEIAKEQLSHLNSDLNMHCRIPALLQPKVTFSSYIQERRFPS